MGTAAKPASCRHGEHRRKSAPHQSRRNGPRHVSRHCRLDAPADESRRGGNGRGASRRWRSLLYDRPSESATGLGDLGSLPIPRAREVSKALERPLPDADIFQHTPRTAGALMVTEFPAVHLDDRAATALDSLRTLDGMARKFTHVLIINDDHELGSQVHMVDLALADDDAPVSSIAVSVVATVDADTAADECAPVCSATTISPSCPSSKRGGS